MTARPHPCREGGFSLVELLVAISVFGVVLVGLTGFLISSVRAVGDQRLRTVATRVAIDRLETLRALPFDDLDAHAGRLTTTTPDGWAFTVDTAVARVDAATGAPDPAGRVKQVTAVVSWTSGGARREASYTTAVAAPRSRGVAPQAIGTITMFPSPITTDASGRPLEDVEVTVPLQGFPVGTLVNLSWSNAGGGAGVATLTSTTGVNWRATIPKEQVRGTLDQAGRGEIEFTVTAGGLSALYSLSMQKVTAVAPVITAATIDRNPLTVARPPTGRTCAAANACLNTTEVLVTATVSHLDPAQDAVVLQYQLFDGTFVEVPLAPVAATTEWRLTVRQRTTKFRTGTGRAFRLTAIRSADGAAATSTVLRDVVST